MRGKVYIVGAGPGDPELLTLKAIRTLALADLVLHDDLVPAAILERVSPAASILNVGKRCGRKSITQQEINSMLVTYAEAGLAVVRLHGGDPLIFGRTGEELRALREAGVDFEVVPGVTAATAAAASLGVSLTERHVASSVVLMTGHHCAARARDKAKEEPAARSQTTPLPNAGAGARDNPLRTTFVVYMPSDFAVVAVELRAAGLDATTPCLVVSAAFTEREQSYLTTLADLPHAPSLPPPRILLAGAAVEPATGDEAKDKGARESQEASALLIAK
jgi:uroporphyrin-III C-methyltransferase